MKKPILLILLLVMSNSILFSQTKETALRDAKIAAKATLESNFNLLLNHTYPPIIEMMGGRENAITTIKTAMESMKSQGFMFEKTEVVAVSDIIKEDGQYRCYVENSNQMKMNDMRIKSKSFLLGIYNDEKKLWYFLEAERLKNKVLVDRVLPNFKTSLVIPKDEMKMEKIE